MISPESLRIVDKLGSLPNISWLENLYYRAYEPDLMWGLLLKVPMCSNEPPSFELSMATTAGFSCFKALLIMVIFTIGNVLVSKCKYNHRRILTLQLLEHLKGSAFLILKLLLLHVVNMLDRPHSSVAHALLLIGYQGKDPVLHELPALRE